MRYFPDTGSTTGGPLYTCWKCNNSYPQGCVHSCPTAVTAAGYVYVNTAGTLVIGRRP